MTRRYLRILLVGSLFTLSACAQQTEVRQMKQSVNTLNTAMDKLNKETVGKRIKWLILPLHESETDRHLIGLSG